MVIIWHYVSNEHCRKTCPFCVKRNGLFIYMPSNSLCVRDWEQDQQNLIVYLPIPIAKNVEHEKDLIVYESIKISIISWITSLHFLCSSQRSIVCISSFLFFFQDYYAFYDLVNQILYLVYSKCLFIYNNFWLKQKPFAFS